MMMRLMLDTSILARICHPRDYRDVQEWFRTLLLSRPAPDLLVSVLAEYELRRMLSRLGATASRDLLDQLAQSIVYVPVTIETARRASDLWVQLRAEDPTNERALSDADVLIAAQAALENATLVSSDARQRRIPGIVVKEWGEISMNG